MNLKSNNPFFKSKSFSKAEATTVFDADGRPVEIIDFNNTMTINGAINKSLILLLLLVGSTFFIWQMAFNAVGELSPQIFPYMIGGAITGFITVLIASFKPNYSPYLAPAYAVMEGVFIGGISAFMETRYEGIVMQAVSGTFVTAAVCFLLYRFKVVKVTQQFRSVVIAATFAIFTIYMLSWIMSFFGIQAFIYNTSLVSIGFSILVIVIAALNLFLDFDLMEQGAKQRLPKYMEWFSGMALMITLVWLYVEFLRLLSKLRD
ncbi:membrane protein [Flavobacterium suaedae]|uniref:Membrane protein n=1 Tax=Flavobacterium suaedae TaxID=1767027 RepID=A0ABQ1K0U1_9FLAO|nr:Bax inhibitor-1/YccA family protein [Flavobacterium suaedae]GGB84466.1 membrane protein [Flavobacterium suaedae]